METYTTDVLVIGGGPAGASAALSLLHYSDAQVTLIEHTDFNRTRVGEHVSAVFFNILDYLKLTKSDFEEGSFLPAYGNTTYWGSPYPTETHAVFTTDASTFQIDRQKFDFRLLEEVVEKGGQIFPRTRCVQFQQLEDNTWEIELNHSERGGFKILAKYIIDASGRKAQIGHQLGVESQHIDELVGVGVFIESDEEQPFKYEQILETTEWGWWYKAVLPDNRAVVTFFTDADIVTKLKLGKADHWNNLLQKTTHVKKHIEGSKAQSRKPWIRNAKSQIAEYARINNFIAVGDAVASFDPVSSMGIGFAMTSACHAARIVKMQLEGKQNEKAVEVYYKDIEGNFKNYLGLRKTFYQKEQRWPESEFWKRRM